MNRWVSPQLDYAFRCGRQVPMTAVNDTLFASNMANHGLIVMVACIREWVAFILSHSDCLKHHNTSGIKLRTASVSPHDSVRRD